MNRKSEIAFGKCSIKLETRVFEGGIIESEIDDLTGKIMRKVLNTQEQQIREALISLGWTPPPDDKP